MNNTRIVSRTAAEESSAGRPNSRKTFLFFAGLKNAVPLQNFCYFSNKRPSTFGIARDASNDTSSSIVVEQISAG